MRANDDDDNSLHFVLNLYIQATAWNWGWYEIKTKLAINDDDDDDDDDDDTSLHFVLNLYLATGYTGYSMELRTKRIKDKTSLGFVSRPKYRAKVENHWPKLLVQILQVSYPVTVIYNTNYY